MRTEAGLVYKVGGAGFRDAESTDANLARVIENEANALVCSGPGGNDGRVTDLAIEATQAFARGDDPSKELDGIYDRLRTHAKDFDPGAVALAGYALDAMVNGLRDGRGFGWVAMAPDRYMAQLGVHRLQQGGYDATYFDPTPWIRRDRQGSFTPNSAAFLAQNLDPKKLLVMPGTLGVDRNGSVVPITPDRRGYTDPTGLIVAQAYQYRTEIPTTYHVIKDDVPAILRANPQYLPFAPPEPAHTLSITEAEALTRGGSGVVHPAVFELLQSSDVMLRVSDGRAEGTVIVRDRVPEPHERLAGIAVQEAVAISVENIQMEHMSGSTAEIADIFKALGVSLIDAQTGAGIVTAFVNDKVYKESATRLDHELEARFGNTLHYRGLNGDEFSVVALVGEALQNSHNRQSVIADTNNLANDLSIPIQYQWLSPAGNAYYAGIPQPHVAQFVRGTYRQFFETETN